MLAIREKKITIAAIFFMAAMAMQFAPVPPTSASDHIDSPGSRIRCQTENDNGEQIKIIAHKPKF